MAIDFATIFWTIGVLALVESLMVFIFPKWVIKTSRKLLRNRKKIMKIAYMEFIVAIVLLVIGILV